MQIEDLIVIRKCHHVVTQDVTERYGPDAKRFILYFEQLKDPFTLTCVNQFNQYYTIYMSYLNVRCTINVDLSKEERANLNVDLSKEERANLTVLQYLSECFNKSLRDSLMR